MRFLRLTMLLSWVFLTASSAFAADAIRFNLVGGTYVGAPQSFFMDQYTKTFCIDSACQNQIQKLQENPTKTEFTYLGTVSNGIQIIDKNGNFTTSNTVFEKDWSGSTEFNAINLFSSGQQIILSLTGVTGISPNPIIFTPGKGWTDDKDNPFTQLKPLPTREGSIFLGFSTRSDPKSSDSLMVIDSSGNMLAVAESLSGSLDLFPLWENDQVNCTAGQYLPIDSYSCTQCPANNWCPGGTFTTNQTTAQGINTCSAGLISDAGSSSSTACHTPLPDSVICPAGQYLPMNSYSCIQCPANSWCPGGNFKTNEGATQGINPCEEGLISDAGSSSIEACMTPPPEIACPAGEYLPVDSEICTICLENYWCPGGNFQIKNAEPQGLNPCEKEYTSEPGSSDIKDCQMPPPETTTCAAGQYLPANTLTCQTCPANSWCPGGTFSQSTSAQGINACGTGLISDAGSSSSTACQTPAPETTTCSAGQYLPANSNSCTQCPANSWCAGGTYQINQSANQGINACPNSGISGTGSSAISSCYKTGLVLSVPNGEGTQTCYWGTVGYTSGCFNYSVKSCIAGYYWAGGNPQCDEVGIGYFSPDGDINRQECPTLVNNPDLQGTTETTTSADSSSCFIEVPFVSDENGMGTMRCVFNPETLYGKAETYEKNENKFPIAPLPDDGQCKNLGMNFCFGGFFLENPDNAYCDPVGNGNFSQRPDLIKYIEQDCLTNPAFCANEYGYDLSKPEELLGQTTCPDPYVNSEGQRDSITNCFKNCSVISVANSASVTAVSTKINYGAQDTTCKFNVTCQSGFQPSGSGTATPSCTEIPPETTTCSAGQYLPANTMTCQTCPANSWCAGGTYQINQSANQGITACGAGLISDAGSSSSSACHTNTTTCTAGQYLPANTLTCTTCVAGNYCTGGTFSQSNSIQGLAACPYDGNSAAQSTSSAGCYKACSSTGMNIPNSTSITPVTDKVYWTSNAYPACAFTIACSTGYHLESSSTSSACVLDEVVCNTDPNASAFNANCEPTKCKFGYHLENKQCISNRMPCPITNGTGVKEWMSDNISGGKWTQCTADSCEAGYTSDRSLTNEKKPCGICRNMRNASGEIVVSSWKNTNCEISTCMYQGERYRLSNNECIPICDTNEDDTGTMRWDSISKKCERTCKPGFTSW